MKCVPSGAFAWESRILQKRRLVCELRGWKFLWGFVNRTLGDALDAISVTGLSQFWYLHDCREPVWWVRRGWAEAWERNVVVRHACDISQGKILQTGTGSERSRAKVMYPDQTKTGNCRQVYQAKKAGSYIESKRRPVSGGMPPSTCM